MRRYESLVDHLAVAAHNGDEYMVRCLFHDDSNASMQFNVDKGLFVCFACGATGNHRTIQKQLGLRFSDGEFDVADIRARLDALKRPATDDVLPVLQESYLDRYAFPTGYWESRGITRETAAIFDLGYDPLGEYVTIPIRNVRGQLLGVIRRFLDPDAELRYRYPKGFKRSTNLFASWLVEADEDCDHVVLVEGALDAIKVWQAGYSALAIYGSSISAQQVRLLRRLGIGQVTLFFDNDAAGRKATDSALGWHVRKRGTKTVREYDASTDLRRQFIVNSTNYLRRSPADPGAMDSRQIITVLQNTSRAA